MESIDQYFKRIDYANKKRQVSHPLCLCFFLLYILPFERKKWKPILHIGLLTLLSNRWFQHSFPVFFLPHFMEILQYFLVKLFEFRAVFYYFFLQNKYFFISVWWHSRGHHYPNNRRRWGGHCGEESRAHHCHLFSWVRQRYSRWHTCHQWSHPCHQHCHLNPPLTFCYSHMGTFVQSWQINICTQSFLLITNFLVDHY